MTVLVIGGGGREHALVWKLSQSQRVEKLFCIPGNAGISQYAECIQIDVMNFSALAAFAKEQQVDLTVVGVDEPLAEGIVDVFYQENLCIFGPDKQCARLESSKSYAKDLMKEYSIPTASYQVFTDPKQAKSYVNHAKFPLVLKADGLAFGKGVIICNNREEALFGINTLMLEKKFGPAGNRIVAEEYLTGPEVSVMVLVDGEDFKVLASAQDYKKAEDGNKGLNTGGMGSISPSPFYTKEIDEYCKKYIYAPTLEAIKQRGMGFHGILFFGLILTHKGPKVLEYNVRFGDPETQAILPRIQTDLADVLESCINGGLGRLELTYSDMVSLCLVLASEGYPENYQTGHRIFGADKCSENELLFHAGTRINEKGNLMTAGGRVFGITVMGKTLKQIRKKAYQKAETIQFKGKYMRFDIGMEEDTGELII